MIPVPIPMMFLGHSIFMTIRLKPARLKNPVLPTKDILTITTPSSQSLEMILPTMIYRRCHQAWIYNGS